MRMELTISPKNKLDKFTLIKKHWVKEKIMENTPSNPKFGVLNLDTQKISRGLKKRGITGIFKLAVAYLSDYLFDFTHGTDTASWVALRALNIDSENISHGGHYQPTHPLSLKNFLGKINLKI